MARKNKFEDIEKSKRESQEAKRKAFERLTDPARKSRKKRNQTKVGSKRTSKRTTQISQTEKSRPTQIVQQVQKNLIPFLDDEGEALTANRALVQLADLYLHAAIHKTRHIGLIWPVTFQTLSLVHAIACLSRWKTGDKLGVRGILFPSKLNVFYPMNHVYLNRIALLDLVREFAESSSSKNPKVVRSCPQKDTFLFSLNDANFSVDNCSDINPSFGELIPTFIGKPGFVEWESSAEKLLSQCRGKLKRRSFSNTLKANECAVIGNPKEAPDAIFSIDGRLSTDEIKRALNQISTFMQPEVVLVAATDRIRKASPSWKSALARFCMALDETFEEPPGVLAVTDEPFAAYQLKNKLWESNKKRHASIQWKNPDEYQIMGIVNTGSPTGIRIEEDESDANPAPREFDVSIVDADVARIAGSLSNIVRRFPGGGSKAGPIREATNFISRIAALPCGFRHLSEYLVKVDVDSRVRQRFDWHAYVSGVRELQESESIGEKSEALTNLLNESSRILEKYYNATPFAHKLAELVANQLSHGKRKIGLVFTSALYLRLAEKFLIDYDDFPIEIDLSLLKERIVFCTAERLGDYLDSLEGSKLVFAGLNQHSLRYLMIDNRILAHSAILLTQRQAKFLKSTLEPIAKNFDQFRVFKPRIESILRQLSELPKTASLFAARDYELPAFKVELSAEPIDEKESKNSNTFRLNLDDGSTQLRNGNSEVFIYDPASEIASAHGFKSCKIRELQAGDQLFIMSPELREMIEQLLREAGIPAHSDQEFETALRDYHLGVQKQLDKKFTETDISHRARKLRSEILSAHPELADTLPQEAAMSHWIDLDRSIDTPFDQLKPQAPMHESAFNAFAQVLGFSKLETAFHWQFVITPIRTRRRLDGRHITDLYSVMLLQPESAIVHANTNRTALKKLFEVARESVMTIEWIGPAPAEER